MKLTRFEDLECWQEARHLNRNTEGWHPLVGAILVIAYRQAAPHRAKTSFAPTCCLRRCPNVVWSDLVRKVYAATSNGTFKKNLRLSGQIQAAAASVRANIAEGFIRHSDKEFTHFLFIAMSSAAEVQSHLYIAVD